MKHIQELAFRDWRNMSYSMIGCRFSIFEVLFERPKYGFHIRRALYYMHALLLHLSPNTNTLDDLHPFKALRMTTCPFLVGSFGSSVWTAKLLVEACRENPKRMEVFYVINVPRVKRHYQHLGKDGKLLVIGVPCFFHRVGGKIQIQRAWYRSNIWTKKKVPCVL